MALIHGGNQPQRPGQPGSAPWLRWGLTVLALGAGLALATPPGEAPPARPALQACSDPGEAGAPLALPPGHPPIGGAQAPRRIITGLPPGHPPVYAQPGGRATGRAPPLEPLFQEPTLVDL